MNHHIPEYEAKQRRILAVKAALNTPNLAADMKKYWQGVLIQLKRRSKMSANSPESAMQQLLNSMEEIIVLLEEIIRTLKSESLRKREKD